MPELLFFDADIDLFAAGHVTSTSTSTWYSQQSIADYNWEALVWGTKVLLLLMLHIVHETKSDLYITVLGKTDKTCDNRLEHDIFQVPSKLV